MATCMLMGAAEDYLLECGNINWGDNAKDCAIDCLLSMLPIPNPCGKFGKWLGMGLGVAGALNSFPGETWVHVRPEGAADGDAASGKSMLKAIADVKPGDQVLSLAEWKDREALAAGDARMAYEPVLNVFTSLREQALVRLTLDTGGVITATEGHPFKTSQGWRDASTLAVGSRLLLKSGATQDTERFASVVSVRAEKRVVQVFNLEVAHAHTFFAGDDGLLVHNTYHPPPRGPLPGFPGAQRNGHTGGRARWNLPDGAFLLWDSLHGRCEKHNKRGKHMGEFDVGGSPTKPPNPNYDLPKGSF